MDVEDDMDAEEEDEEEEDDDESGEPMPEDTQKAAPIIPNAVINLSRVRRNILADKPRVIRFVIDWD